MKHPFFSVVIPTFNRCAFLAETLDSIQKQSFQDYEIIIVDNLSDDGTAEMIAARKESLNYIREQNSGPGPARNIGLGAARGTYIAFLDSDDLWFPWTLETYADVIQKTNSPSFLTGKPLVFEDVSALSPSRPSSPPQWNTFRDYLDSGDAWRWHGVSSFVIRKSTLDEIGGFDKRPMNAEDADLALRLGTAPGFIEITQPLQFAYRSHGANLTKDARENLKGIHSMIEKEQAGEFPGGRSRRRERIRIISRHIRPLTLSCLKTGQREEASELYWKTFRWNFQLSRFSYLLAFPAMRLKAKLWAGAKR